MRYILFLLLFICQIGIGQSFTTRTSQSIIGREDVLQVEYIAENVSMEQFNLPRFANWTMVSGPSLSTSKVISGSNSYEQIIYSVMLKPKVGGVLVVPGAIALINKKPQRSNQVSVQVKNVSHVGGGSASRPQPQPSFLDIIPDQLPAHQTLRAGEDPVEKIKRNLFVRLEVSKSQCFVGEPVIALYKLCTRLKSKSKVIKQPSFSGCKVIELTGNYQDQHIEKIDGEEYNVFIIRKVQLTPLDSGNVTLPSVVVENEVSFHGSGSTTTNIFGEPTGPVQKHTVRIQNKPQIIQVNPLPPFNGNGVLSGAIGDFNISIQPAEEEFTTAGTNHLMVIIEGHGNLQPVKVPVMNWPKGIESFEATETEEIEKERNPVIVRKIFTVPFSADKLGNYVLPQVLFTYFDPNKKMYVNKTTPAYMLKVVSGSSNFMAKATDFDNDNNFDLHLIIILGAAVLAVIIGLAWYNNKQKSTTLQPLIMPVNETLQPPVSIKETLSSEYLYNILQLEPTIDTSVFYKQLNNNLCKYLQSRFGIQPTEINTFAESHLTQAVLLHKLEELIKQCTLGIYTPVFNQEQALNHRLEAIEIIENLDRTISI